jgi:NTE family protein
MAKDLEEGRLPQLRRTHRRLPRPDFARTALVLQGGGALGAYQAGAYQALSEAGLELDWLAGVSIGAINAALIAGNAPADRLERLKTFWDGVSVEPAPLSLMDAAVAGVGESDAGRAWLNHLSAANALTLGVPDFFHPRWPPPWSLPDGNPGATSVYDTAPLRRRLAALVDFGRLNNSGIRFSVGAVNVRSGNFIFFDNQTDIIGPEHILASAALPPMFPAVDIGGQAYWDGGLVSNTPLQWVVDAEPHVDTLVFQVDLWNTRGQIPRDLAEVMTREREIQFASRTRAATDTFRRLQRLKNAVTEVLQALPEDQRASPRFATLAREAEPMALRIVHLIYHAKWRQGTTKEFEFSRFNIREHWTTGYRDAVRTLRHPEALSRPPAAVQEGVGAFDVAVHGRL